MRWHSTGEPVTEWVNFLSQREISTKKYLQNFFFFFFNKNINNGIITPVSDRPPNRSNMSYFWKSDNFVSIEIMPTMFGILDNSLDNSKSSYDNFRHNGKCVANYLDKS